MITLEGGRLLFSFPEVHKSATCKIDFQRTLRVPNDSRTYPLPAGLGKFPLCHIDDLADGLPARIVKRGGVALPMRMAEAMWVHFFSGNDYPFAVKVATGKINAITGEAWTNTLNQDPQDSLVLPRQQWLDGYSVAPGLIRQFVAAPLGAGITAEEQLTGMPVHGGLQVIVYPMKRDVYEDIRAQSDMALMDVMTPAELEKYFAATPMGLAPGGLIRQEIYEDRYGFDVWDRSASSRCFLTILDWTRWQSLTGEEAPSRPITKLTYDRLRIPWFDYYSDEPALAGSSRLAELKTMDKSAALGGRREPEESSRAEPVIQLGPKVRPEARRRVREGENDASSQE
jgi:hypothetical protein